MQIIDYNGSGNWSWQGIQERYALYCRMMNLPESTSLVPTESTQGERKWVYPVMEKVIKGIEEGDCACIRIGIEFIEEDTKFPFGKILKSNTARALRRALLGEDQKDRIRARLAQMLIKGNVPHEYKQYAKLLKKIGVDPIRESIQARADMKNPYVAKYVRYLMEA
jgi:hypothetical protein